MEFLNQQLGAAVRHVAEARGDGPATPPVLALSRPGLQMLVERLSQSAVSLHLDSPVTALIAATFRDKLPILLMQRTSDTFRLAAAIHEIEGASHVVVLDVEQTSLETPLNPLMTLSACFLPEPELLVVGSDWDPEAVWHQFHRCETVTGMMLLNCSLQSVIRLQQHPTVAAADIGEDFAMLSLRATGVRVLERNAELLSSLRYDPCYR